MRSIRQSFLISLYLVVCLGATMLALAETGVPLSSLLSMARGGAIISIFPALLTLPIAAIAYRVVEKRGWAISSRVASILGVVALCVSLFELWARSIEGRLLFGAHLLVYLSWILLFQEKKTRQRWGLVALAILQVAVGSVLTNAGWYGMLLVAFLGLSIWTLVLLQISEAEDRHAAASDLDRETLPLGLHSLLASGTTRPLGHATVTHWPQRQVLASVLLTMVGSLGIGAAFFLLIPRVDFGMTTFKHANEPLGRRAVTGFTDHVRLGAFSQILESSAPAFDVQIHGENGESIEVESYAARLGMAEPLFRGLTLTHYENGEWTAEQSESMTTLRRSAMPGTVTQEYHLRMEGPEVLFAIAPVVGGRIKGGEQAMRFSIDSRVIRDGARDEVQGNLRYEIYSPAQRESIRAVSRFQWEQPDWDEYLQLPGDLDRLDAVANAVAGGAMTDRQTAHDLLAYLRNSGEFRYSLSGGMIDPRLDPVEDFLLNRKSGHCEFFASALALMLRAEGVPSRVVNGYKGGDVNRVLGRYEVQQRHAHSWVEALVDGQWVTLDPSPAAGRASTVKANAPKLPLWSELISSSTTVWRDYVVQLNMTRQREAFSPLRRAAILVFHKARDEWWPAFKSQAYAFITDPTRWFSWQGGLVTFIGLLVAVGGWWSTRRALQRLRRGGHRGALGGDRRTVIDFYEEFRHLCAKHGWRAEPTQTPREFAADVTDSLRTMHLPGELLTLPGELTSDYYQLRFGDIELQEGRREALQGRLTALRDSFARSENGREQR